MTTCDMIDVKPMPTFVPRSLAYEVWMSGRFLARYTNHNDAQQHHDRIADRDNAVWIVCVYA